MVKSIIRYQVRVGTGRNRSKRDSFKKKSDADKLVRELKKKGTAINPRVAKIVFSNF
jgi:hypothetical protein